MAGTNKTAGGREFPPELKYHKEHTWARLEEKTAWVGISDYAQGELEAVIFIELPQVGDVVTQGQPFGGAESVKTISTLFAPLSGRVVAVNTALEEKPELVNEDPYGAGWMIQITADNAEELTELLSAEAYSRLLQL